MSARVPASCQIFLARLGNFRFVRSKHLVFIFVWSTFVAFYVEFCNPLVEYFLPLCFEKLHITQILDECRAYCIVGFDKQATIPCFIQCKVSVSA